ncbi:MAG: alpha/beta fold hydrolase [Actinobacteria bacterium]|nr:alpha/beta fold hydrolase [Actinomycetota bacterium]
MNTTGTADSDGTHIHYEVVGSGDRPLLMLPGLGIPGRAFGPLLELLASDRRVIVVDPRGSGASDGPDAPYTGELVARDACAVLDAAGVERADVLGLSMGGCIAQELAIRHSERVRSLVLLSTLARADAWFTRLLGVRRAVADGLGLEVQRDLGLCLLFSPAAFREHAELVERLEATMRASTPNAAAYLRQLDFCLAHDAAERLGAVRAPALVITGERDLLTTPYLARELAEALPGARYVEVAGASHGLWLEQPQRVAELVGELLAQRPPR